MSSANDLSRLIAEGLKEYSEEIADETDKLVDEVGDWAVKELKASSPKRTRRYARNWRKKKDKKGSLVIHNAAPTYRLTHLLERSHVLRNGGRSKAQPHIEPVEQEVISKMESGIEKIVRG